MKTGWIPPRSPFSLIQEDLWSTHPDSEWRIIVVCMMLNCTSRKQVTRVLPEFLRRWPGPRQLIESRLEDVIDVVRSLGFGNRRAAAITKMSRSYLDGGWTHARELPGVGDYAASAWELFCQGIVSDEPPKDHALTLYHAWLRVNLSSTH